MSVCKPTIINECDGNLPAENIFYSMEIKHIVNGKPICGIATCPETRQRLSIEDVASRRDDEKLQIVFHLT